jgi:hypothetical protein
MSSAFFERLRAVASSSLSGSKASLLAQALRESGRTIINDDQSECVVLERFRDSEALIEHAENLGDIVEAILATVSVVHGELLGEPSAELRARLAGSEVPHLFTPYQSM